MTVRTDIFLYTEKLSYHPISYHRHRRPEHNFQHLQKIGQLKKKIGKHSILMRFLCHSYEERRKKDGRVFWRLEVNIHEIPPEPLLVMRLTSTSTCWDLVLAHSYSTWTFGSDATSFDISTCWDLVLVHISSFTFLFCCLLVSSVYCIEEWWRLKGPACKGLTWADETVGYLATIMYKS